MGFFNFFRPDWQHSDPKVRKEAVAKLDASNQATLQTVAQNDADPEIRRSAIRKLDSVEILQSILSSETDSENQKEAEARLNERWTAILKNFSGEPSSKELAAVESLAKTRYAEDLIKILESKVLRETLVQKTSRSAVLEFAALKDSDADVASIAVEHIDKIPSLQNIAKNARLTDIRKKAAEKVRKLTQPASEKIERDNMVLLFHKRDAIIGQAQRLANAKDFMTNDAEFQKLLKTATELGMGPAQTELDRIVETYRKRREDEKLRLDEAASAAVNKAKEHELETILLELDKILESFSDEKREQAEALIAKFKDLNGDAETPLAGLFRMSQARFERLLKHEAEIEEETNSSRAEILAQLKLLADSEDSSKMIERKVKSLVRKWENLPLMEGEEPELQTYNTLRSKLTERFEAQREADEKVFLEKSEQLQKIIAAVQAIDENSNFKDISQKLRDSYHSWREAVGEDKFRYKDLWNKYQEATSRFKEMQAWESWHNEHDRETLLEEAEALAQEEPSKEVLAKLKSLAIQWKSAGPVSAARVSEFRDKFRAIFESIMEKCEPILQAQEEERKQNLAAKEELCAQIESLAAADDGNFRDRYKAMQELQEKWKTIGMVPKENVQHIWDRFRAAENAFFAKHKDFLKKEDAARAENLAKKIALCEKAEKIAESTDWNATSAELRRLQEEWKKTGPVPRSKSEETWNRFRMACDGFFERKRAHFEEIDASKAKNLEAKEALCAKLEAMELDPSDPESLATIEAAETEWKTIGMVPKEKVDEIWDRFSAILDKFAEKRLATDAEFRAAVEEAKSKKQQILLTISSLLESAGSSQSSEIVKKLQSDWKALPRCGSTEHGLYQKFRTACDEFFSRRRDQLDIQEQARENNLQNKLRLCEEAERLLNDLTDENRRESMNVVKQLRRHWKEIGAVPRKDSDRIWNRFNSACDAIFGKKESEPTSEPEAE